MAEDIRWQQLFSNYCKALERLEDFLEPPALNEREQQGLIKAFEYTYELAWNTLRDLLRSQGDASLLGSRDALREAFRLGLIEQGEAWMQMLQDRNLTNHTNSHVLPALIRRFHEAAKRGDASVTCWGTGTPLREFLHVDDLGEASVFALEHWQPGPEEQQFLNVGTGVDLTIRELSEAVAAATRFQGQIHWDASKPDGTPKKQLDVSRLAELGWRARIPLAEGLRSTVAEFCSQLSQQLVRL